MSHLVFSCYSTVKFSLDFLYSFSVLPFVRDPSLLSFTYADLRHHTLHTDSLSFPPDHSDLTSVVTHLPFRYSSLSIVPGSVLSRVRYHSWDPKFAPPLGDPPRYTRLSRDLPVRMFVPRVNPLTTLLDPLSTINEIDPTIVTSTLWKPKNNIKSFLGRSIGLSSPFLYSPLQKRTRWSSNLKIKLLYSSCHPPCQTLHHYPKDITWIQTPEVSCRLTLIVHP